MIRRNFLKLFALFGASTTLSANSINNTKEQELKLIELNEFYIAGLWYYKKDFNASCSSLLTLKRELKNVYDTNAIEVYYKEFKLGYIPRVENKLIAKMMDQNIRIVAKVTKFNVDDAYAHKIKIKLYQVLV